MAFVALTYLLFVPAGLDSTDLDLDLELFELELELLELDLELFEFDFDLDLLLRGRESTAICFNSESVEGLYSILEAPEELDLDLFE